MRQLSQIASLFIWHGHAGDLINAISAGDTETRLAALRADLMDAEAQILRQLKADPA